MKILYHHRTASKDGQAVHIDELVTALRDLGHEVHVVGPGSGNDTVMGSTVDWIDRLKATLPKSLYESMELTYSALAYQRLAHAVRELRPDVIYERYNLFMLGGVAARRRFGVPMLLEVNAPLVHERSRFGGMGLPRIGRWAEGATWRRADFVLPVTKVLSDYVAAYGVPRDRIVVIPNGINEKHFANAPTNAEAKARLGLGDALVLGFTGFVRPWHEVDRVIRWLGRSHAPSNAHLLIVGDGPVRADLERLAESIGVMKRLTFTGVLSRERVPEHVAAFDIALQPAVVPYASPLKLFEYLALGKAIVAPRQPNIEEILDDGDNALLFDPNAPDGLDRVLDSLVASPELAHRIAEGARATIARRGLTWEANAKRIESLAKQATENRALEGETPGSRSVA